LAVAETKLSRAKLMTVIAAKGCDVEWMNQAADWSIACD